MDALEKALAELDNIDEAEKVEEPELEKVEQGEVSAEQPRMSCNIDDFKPKICRPEKTAILFLGTETENPDNILNALSELQDALDMDMGVLDMADDSCEKLSDEYKIDRQVSQLVIFQNCEKKVALSLEGDPKERIEKLKEMLKRETDEKVENVAIELDKIPKTEREVELILQEHKVLEAENE